MKKICLIGYLVVLLMVLTSCISAEERKQGKEDVRVGKKLIKEYVKQTYGKRAKVSDYEAVYISASTGSVVPNLSRNASGYVKATVKMKNNTFDIMYHVKTDEVLTSENIGRIQDSFLNYSKDILPFEGVMDCNMEVDFMLYYEQYIDGFLRPEIKSYKDLVDAGEYHVKLTLRCINQDVMSILQMQWEQFLSPFFSTNTESTIYMILVNYKDEEGYQAEADTDYYSTLGTTTAYYATEEATKYAQDILYIDCVNEKIEIYGETE